MKYKTQMEAAKKGFITDEMKVVAEKEGICPEELREKVARGIVAIPANKNHKNLSPYGIGEGLSTKINVNLGISKDCKNIDTEMVKVHKAINMGVESIMDLSSFGKTEEFGRRLIDESPAIMGTVPVYDAVGFYDKKLEDIKAEEFLDVVRKHGENGVDFVTIHAGLNRESIATFKENPRLMNIVSRGGSLLYTWMELNKQENPFYEYYDELLEIYREYDITISLGDAMRPGAIEDGTDASQVHELIKLEELIKRAWEKMFDLALEPEKPRRYREESMPELDDTCTMCGEICAVRSMNKLI